MNSKTLSLIAGLGLAAASVTAHAVPNLNEITGIAGTAGYTDTTDEFVTLSDVDTGNDDATAFLLLEIAANANTNAFGIYGFDFDMMGDVTLGEELQVFDGPDTQPLPLNSVTLRFDLMAGTVTNQSTMVTRNIGAEFGFYLEDTAGMNTYFSHTALNSDGFDHALLFDTSDNSVGALLGSDVVVAFEDLPNGGDADFNDLVVGVSDVTVPSAIVPEPQSLALVGAGLLLASFSRRMGRRA